MTSIWINTTPPSTIDVSHRTPGAYDPPSSVPVTETAADAVPGGSGNRYITLINEGPSLVYATRGGTASATLYNHIFPVGINLSDFRIGDGENLSVICAAGQTATLKVAIANELEV